MRILHVITAFDLGGAEESVTLLAIGLAARGHQCWVAAVNSTDDKDGIGKYMKDRLSRAGVRCFDLGGPNLYANAGLAPLRIGESTPPTPRSSLALYSPCWAASAASCRFSES